MKYLVLLSRVNIENNIFSFYFSFYLNNEIYLSIEYLSLLQKINKDFPTLVQCLAFFLFFFFFHFFSIFETKFKT